jgi:hypothetical protein
MLRGGYPAHGVGVTQQGSPEPCFFIARVLFCGRINVKSDCSVRRSCGRELFLKEHFSTMNQDIDFKEGDAAN